MLVTPRNHGVLIGGGGGNRTRVRRSYTEGFYMLMPGFDLTARPSPGRDFREAIPLKFRLGAAGSLLDYPTKLTIHLHPWERLGGSVAGY